MQAHHQGEGVRQLVRKTQRRVDAIERLVRIAELS